MRGGASHWLSGSPLGFYHFTGLDSGNHDVALQYAGQPDGIQADLVQNYREALTDSARQYRGGEWSFKKLRDGTEIAAAWRQAYRDDAALQERFPDPWQSDGVAEALKTAAGHAKPGFISPGFVAGNTDAIDLGRLGQHLAATITKPSRWMALLRSARGIVGREGWRGLRRRMSRSDGERM